MSQVEFSPHVSSLYAHIPYCRSKCSYCDFFSVPSPFVPDDYVIALCNQIELFCRQGFPHKNFQLNSIKTLYFGGGTPSLLSASQLFRIMETVRPLLEADAEVTLEVNPESLSAELLETAAAAGMNRISMGIQSLQDGVLGCVGRCCTADRTRSALRLLAESGIPFCTDFIAGLPGLGDKEFLDGLAEVVALNPHHVSLYGLTVAEGTRLHRQIQSGQVQWFPEAADSQWIAGRDFLEAAGYPQYEVSNFAPPGMESRHNSVYWKQRSYFGAGAGAAGSLYRFGGAGRLLGGTRYTNTTDIAAYIDFWQNPPVNPTSSAARNLEAFPAEFEALEPETLAFEHLMLGLRMREGVSGIEFRRRFGRDLDSAPFQKFCQRGWTQKVPAGYAVTGEGLLFLNRMLQELLD